MLYEEGYAAAPISYYPDPYPNYYYPTAPYFAGFVTGAIFGAVVDWDRRGVWGGRFDGNDINIDCDHCFNRFDRNGKVNFNDVDWKNLDRSKIKFDHNQFAKIDKTNIRNRLEAGGNNDIRTKAKSVKARAATASHARVTPSAIKDIRANKIAGGGGDLRQRAANRPSGERRGEIANRANRDGHHAMAGKRDARPHRSSGLGGVRSRSAANLHSHRGGRAMGGGLHASRPEFAGHRGGGGAHFSGGGRRGGAHFSGGGHRGGAYPTADVDANLTERSYCRLRDLQAGFVYDLGGHSLLTISARATTQQRASERKAIGENVVAPDAREAEQAIDPVDLSKQYGQTRKLSSILIDRKTLLPVAAAALIPFAIAGASKLPYKGVFSVLKKLLLI